MRPALPLFLLALLPGAASAGDIAPLELDQVLIDDASTEQERAAARLQAQPGASSLVDMEHVEQGRVSTNQDVLAYQPGVFAQSAGNEGIKLSIRGSGINRAPGAHGSGVYAMFDGLPLTGPGGTPYELLEPLWLNRVEVLRGANGLQRGALALGGAVNYITHTGYDAAPLQVRYEVGSRGYSHRQISSGQVLGDLDYYVALTDMHYDGYQTHSEGRAKGVAANLGYRFDANLETRFYLRYRETDNQLAGRLTQAQIKHDPRAVNPVYLRRDASRPQPGSTWLANKTTYTFDDDSSLVAGLVYHDFPMDLREGPNRLKVAYSDVSGTLDYHRRDTLAGHQSNTTLGWRTSKHLPNTGASEFVRVPEASNGLRPIGTRTRDFSYQGSDTVLHVSNDLELRPDLWLTTGLAMIYTRRESDVSYPGAGGKVSQHDWDYAPRIGLRYDIDPALQVFGNLSRSVEPPHPWSLIWSSPPVAGGQIQPIEMRNQTATTFELGARGDAAVGRYAQVRHELLAVELVPNISTAEFNASPTVHQGLEAGLDSTLWQRADGGRLGLRQAYTYSDFHYRNDARFGGNRLPGLPVHYYQGELRYDWPSGFYAAANTQLASKVQVDYANSRHAEAYALFGARLGWNSPKQDWQTWLDLRNLGGERYSATVTPGFDDNGQDVARSTPGEGRAAYVGVSYSFR